MPDGARTVVDIVVGNYNLLARIIKFGKGPKLALISLFFGYRIGYLDILLLVTLIGHKIDFMSSVIIYLESIAHVDQFVVYDVFKVMC